MHSNHSLCLPANRNGLGFADFEVKLKASISTVQASGEGSDLKADRTGATPALSFTDRLLAFDSYQGC